MASSPDIASDDPAPPQSRWARATSETGGVALRELAGSYWYCVYAWWRRAGLEESQAATATLVSFTRWLGDTPPNVEDFGVARMREWLPARLAELAAAGVKLNGPAALEIEADWAEQRYADEPPGEPDAIFQRRWALTVLEFSTTTIQAEYAARGEDALFAELLPFAGFEPGDDQRYVAAAARTGRTSGAMRKAVFDFRSRQREVLRAYVGDTVADPADIDSEMTALLCACEAAGVQMTPLPGMETPAAPLPTAIRALRPDEVFARAMQSVRMTHAGPGGWKPPTVEEAARLFPSYEVLSLLGRGGMGAVYQARQIELDRLVAIKLLPLEVSVDQDFADRFRREARAMAKLDHPNIIAVHDFGTTTEGHLFFAMAYVEGANLHELIHAKRADAAAGLSPARALEIITGVCDALAYAHGRGIVHRDIKPANVMVSTEGHVKVADFGLARLTDPTAESLGHTVTGTVMGTPAYMAPEQMRGMNVDHRADIYSVGVMLYEALCKETPHGAFEPPSARIGCDPAIDAIVIKAMQQAPERRYQSTQEMKVAAAAVRTQITSVVKPNAVPPSEAPVPKSASASPVARSKKALFIGITVGVLALAVGLTQWAKQNGGTRSRASQTSSTPVAGGPASPSAAAKEPKLKPREAAERLLAMGAIFSHGPALNPNADTSEVGQGVNLATRVDQAAQIPSGRFSITQVEFLRARAEGGPTTDAEWEILESLPEVVTVRFSKGSDVTDAAIEKLKACRKLQMIKIESAGRFTGATFGALVALPELTRIGVNNCAAFGDNGAKALSQLRHLQGLFLSSTSVTDTGLAAVAELPQLNKFTLAQVEKLTGAGLTALTKATSLRALSLIHFRGFGGDAVQALANFPALEDLTLHGSTPITDASLPSLAALPKLRRLTLDKIAGVNGEGFAQWPVRPVMGELLMWTDQSATDNALLAIVTAFPKLTRLDVPANVGKVTPDGLAILAKLRQLAALSLPGDALDDAGFAQLARCDQLTHLDVGSARATEAGVQSLSKLRFLQDLTWLNPPVTDAMLKSYAKLSKLTTFRIGKEAPPETEQKLKAALPKVKIER